MALVQEEHDSEVTQSFVAKAWAGHELQTFHLAEVGLGAKHVDVKELGNIIVSRVGVLLSEGCTNCS